MAHFKRDRNLVYFKWNLRQFEDALKDDAWTGEDTKET